MNTNTHTALNQQVEAGNETSKFALGVGLSMAALVGIWGVASLVSALVLNGPVGTLRGLFTAITGM